MTRGLRQPMHAEEGFTLVEMLMVMVLMGIVMGSLTTVFVSGSRAQSELNQYFQAQQESRMALDRIRADVHCALKAQASTSINGFPGVKLDDTNCYTSTPTITWCVLPSIQQTGRFALWRSTVYNSATCTSSDTSMVRVADYLMPVGSPASANNILATPTIAYQGLETVGVDFKVSVNAPSAGRNIYELADSLVTRNYVRCATVGGCSVPSVP